MKFCDKLIMLRKQKGISQEQLADVLEVSRQSVYKWESGANMPDMAKLDKLRTYFGVSFDYLLNDDEDGRAEGEGATRTHTVKNAPRDVFASNYNNTSGEDVAFEHGYASNRKKRFRKSAEFFRKRYDADKAYLEGKGYVNLIRLKPTYCIWYFEDPKSKTFGFYFGGTEKFVCPFENYIDCYVDRQMLGGQSHMFGLVTTNPLKMPSHYGITVLYSDTTGNNKEYRLSLGSVDGYLRLDQSKKTIKLWDETSVAINGSTNKLAGALKRVSQEADLIRFGEIAVENIDVAKYKAKDKGITEQREKEKKEMKMDYIFSRFKFWLITICAVIGTIAILSIISSL